MKEKIGLRVTNLKGRLSCLFSLNDKLSSEILKIKTASEKELSGQRQISLEFSSHFISSEELLIEYEYILKGLTETITEFRKELSELRRHNNKKIKFIDRKIILYK